MRYSLLLLFIFYSCTSVPNKYKNIQHINPSQDYITSFRSADTIAVVVNQNLKDWRKQDWNKSLPISNTIIKIINSYVGIECIESKDTSYSHIIQCDISGELLGAEYITGGYMVTGAKVYGVIKFQAGDFISHLHTFSGLKLPQREVSWFGKAHIWQFTDTIKRGDFYEQIFLFVNEVFGISPLRQAVMDRNSAIAMGAIKVLGKIKDNKAVPILIERLKSGDSQLRITVVYNLGNLQDERAFEPLAQLINNDRDYDVSIAAIYGIRKLDPSRAVDPLLMTMSNRNWQIRKLAVEQLGYIGSVRAVEPLIMMLDDERVYVQRSAYNSLIMIINRKTKSRDKDEWLIWWNENKEQYINTN